MKNVNSEPVMQTWLIAVIAAAAVLLLLVIILVVLKINKNHRIKASEVAVNEKVKETASTLSTSFGGNENIQEITTRGSRVTVMVKDPAKVDKETIGKNLDSVMYMGNKVVFIIGEKSEEFQKLLSQNINRQTK
jgi:phosphotransferase system IIB component